MLSHDLHSLAALGLTLTADVKGRSARAPSAPPVRPSEQANHLGLTCGASQPHHGSGLAHAGIGDWAAPGPYGAGWDQVGAAPGFWLCAVV